MLFEGPITRLRQVTEEYVLPYSTRRDAGIGSYIKENIRYTYENLAFLKYLSSVQISKLGF